MGVLKNLFARLSPVQVAERGAPMQFVQEWNCGCGAKLKIKSREPHESGPSNYQEFPEGHGYAGHSILQPSDLTWEGMAEERGWQARPTKCPACQRGMTMAQYKAHRRVGGQ